MSAPKTVALVLVVGLVLAGPACQWRTQAELQRDSLQEIFPGPLVFPERDHPRSPPMKLRLRVHATPEHRAREPLWRERFAERVQFANPYLRRWFGAEFEVLEQAPWELDEGGRELSELLTALRSHDPGEGVDWVIGLAGPLPQGQRHLHALTGSASHFGRHLMLRTTLYPDDAHSWDRSHNLLSRDERRRVYFHRQSRAEVSALLRTWAITFGVPFKDAPGCFMRPFGDQAKHERFSQAATELIELGLSRFREARAEPAVLQSWSSEVLTRIDRRPEHWWNRGQEAVAPGEGYSHEHAAALTADWVQRGNPGFASLTQMPNPTEPSGGLPDEAILSVITANVREVRACYQIELAKQWNLCARISIQFVIGPDGKVGIATPTENDSGLQSLEDCMLAHVLRWVFPRPERGGLVQVNHRWAMVTEDGKCQE